MYELKCQEHQKNSHAKTKSQLFQRHRHQTKFQAHVGPEHNGRQGEAFVYDVHRMSVLGKAQKEARVRIRAALEPGFYIPLRKEGQVHAPIWQVLALSWRRLMDHTFAGNAMPKRAEYDGVRRLCARDGVREEEDSSSTVSCSSSSEGSA